MILRSAFAALSGAVAAPKLSILIFHRVLERPDPLFPGEVDARQFDQICAWVTQWFHVMPLADAIQALYAQALPSRALAITFDDGYADNATVAVPILARHGLHATFFIATGFLDGGCMWNDGIIEAVRRTALPALPLAGLDLGEGAGTHALPLDSVAARQAAIRHLIGHAKYLPHDARLAASAAVLQRAEVVPPTDLMMSSAQVSAMAQAGMALGGHTVTHPILKGMPAARARDEIEQGRRTLERLAQRPIGLFAYPNGKPGVDYDEATTALVREAGFDAAVSTGWGASTPATDRFALRRFTPWDRTRTRFGLRLLANLARDEGAPG